MDKKKPANVPTIARDDEKVVLLTERDKERLRRHVGQVLMTINEGLACLGYMKMDQ
tara:strand:- start:16 stop:183 length:168 start_codon:yes stop_codon:yes gene_type:complete